jgi:hypothetical protein
LRFSMLAVFVVLVLVLVQTLSVSNSFLGVLDHQHNAFGEISGNVTSLTEKAVALNSLGRFDEALAYLGQSLVNRSK